MSEQRDAFERRVSFHPAFDKRHTDPAKNCGVGSATIFFALIGTAGAVSFSMSTGWNLPHVVAEQAPREAEWLASHGRGLLFAPQSFSLNYHRSTKREDYEGDARPCDLLPGGLCYGDVTFLGAQPVLARLIAEGDAGVWAALEGFYHAHLSNVPAGVEPR